MALLRRVISPDSIPSFTAKQYGWNVALKFFCYEMKRSWREQCYFESSDHFNTFVDALTAEQGDNIITEKDAEFADDTDKAIDAAVSRKFNIIFPLITFEAWKTIRDENIIRSVNQQIAVARSNKEQSEINLGTEEHITKNVPLDKKTMFSYFKEWSKIDLKAWSKYRQAIKKAKRQVEGQSKSPPSNVQNEPQAAAAQAAGESEVESAQFKSAQAAPAAPKRKRKSRRCSLRKRQKIKALSEVADSKIDNYLHSQFIRRTNQFKERLRKQYGFIANPALNKYVNAINIIGNMPADTYFSQPINKATFSYTNNSLLPGTKSLLNLGLKFCLKAKEPTNIMMSSIARFVYDVRTKHWLLTQNLPDDDDFNPKLYLKSPDWNPPYASEAIESALKKFEEHMSELHAQHQANPTNKNITYLAVFLA
eukprot:scaffold82339_cov63-Cyclotella_meneghiniana.AAC.4